MILPGSIKKIIAIFRGEVAPLMIVLSVLLGFWFGLMPGWSGLQVVLLAAALIINIHIGIFVMSAAVGKALCYAAAPLMYHVGIWVQESSGAWLRLLAGIPIIGVTDFSRYSVAGTAFLGPLLGLILGLALAQSVISFRRAWLNLQGNSEALKRWRAKGWVRLLDRILIGKSVKDVRDVLTRRPKIVRKAGVAVAVVLVAASAIGIRWAQNSLTAGLVADALTEFNGAEVNVDRVELKVLAGSLAASGIQVTNPEQPANNSVAIGEIAADLGLWNLLLGRVVIENVKLSAVEFDQPRATPGRVLVKPDETQEPAPFDLAGLDLSDVDPAQLESYFKDFKAIRDQLQEISKWLPDPSDKEKPAPEDRPVPESYLAYLTARAPTSPTPRIVVKQIQLDKVDIPIEQFGNCKITCTNMSDAPEALGESVTIQLASNDLPTKLQIVCHYDQPESGATVKAEFDDVDLAKLQSKLNDKNPVSFKSGTAGGSVKGTATRHTIDLALKVRTADLKLQSAGTGVFNLDPRVTDEAMKVLSNVETTLRVVGPITQPSLAFDVPALQKEFADALVKAGKDELARQIDTHLGEHLAGTGIDPGGIVKDPLKAAGGLLGGNKPENEEEEDEGQEDTGADSPVSRLLDGLPKP